MSISFLECLGQFFDDMMYTESVMFATENVWGDRLAVQTP
jgi:hypothetical protein